MKINSLRDFLDYPISEAAKILSICLSSFPNQLETDDLRGTDVLRLQGREVSRVVFVANNDPILPIFNRNLNALMFQVKEA